MDFFNPPKTLLPASCLDLPSSQQPSLIRPWNNFIYLLLFNRASENFRGCLPQYPPKNLGQFLSALAISGHSERFSPGQICSEVGGPEGLFRARGPPTSERILPGENLSE